MNKKTDMNTTKTTTKTTTLYIPVGVRKYPLTITYTGEVLEGTELVHVFCQEARLDQDYPKEDLSLLLQDMEYLIRDEQAQKKNSVINIRVKAKDKELIQNYAQQGGFKSISEYMLARSLA
ncbi:MAG: hypothetical protein CR971_01530 [candidate division SR1 bacterium]|nr:MAG: hypothetical protein CR971_01530 [candidate division SR1 bacterium]